MLTILQYLIVMALVGGAIFLGASAVFGRSEELPPLPPGTTATVLPAEGVTGADVDALRFQQVLRGYKASEVDWALHRLGMEIDYLRTQLEQRDSGPSEEAEPELLTEPEPEPTPVSERPADD
ncbi:DivIVA domain-containing protein [Rhodococcus sp. OK302]|uniref:DivIVA domain-containing protein n=1 Tax=Rhodococcus sp. OK302 TaxID=1882769 RepID=UPI000B94546F|nr:DivIVA domain-containing protein [Rhodococcus sp. OK302]OYD71526.1 DivIVA domain-containing protein [Rhodococcus sp. OK302]